jgi:hypothetical protein
VTARWERDIWLTQGNIFYRIASVKLMYVTTWCRHPDLRRCSKYLQARFLSVVAYFVPPLHRVQQTVSEVLHWTRYAPATRRNIPTGVAQCHIAIACPSARPLKRIFNLIYETLKTKRNHFNYRLGNETRRFAMFSWHNNWNQITPTKLITLGSTTVWRRGRRRHH